MKVTDLNPNEYHSYFKTYLDKVGDEPLIKSLMDGKVKTIEFFSSIPESKLNYSYEDSKWTVKEVLIHIIDTERVFNYRALQFARSNDVSIEGFDENEFVKNANVHHRRLENILDEYKTVSESSISLFKSFSEDSLLKIGKANNTDMSVRAIGFLICGHEMHHVQVVKNRYL